MTTAPASAGKARRLRQRLTDAERRFWVLLRDRRLQGWKFRRQAPIGPYVADFYCAAAKLVIELDGGQHAEGADHRRTDWLESQGYSVIRFWNNDALANTDGVMSELLRHLQAKAPLTLSLSREGRGNAVVGNRANNASVVQSEADSWLRANARSIVTSEKLQTEKSDGNNSVPSPLAGEGQGEGGGGPDASGEKLS
ncbi:MAG TPA: endonuclease domain-containing protein [Dongiaceae bacterium]|nr:endonuclease domain-containing protein [Dongiaceae bacterium]